MPTTTSAGVDPIILNLLVVSLMIAILSLTWAFVRLINKTTETLEEVKKTNSGLNKLVKRATEDYEYVSKAIKGVSATVEKLNKEVLGPIRSIGNIFKITDAVFRSIMDRVKSEPEPDDYLPEEE